MFIYSGAQAELQSAVIRTEVAELHVSDVISHDYVLIKGSVTLQKLYKAVFSAHKHIAIFKSGDRMMELSRIPLESFQGKVTAGMISKWAKEMPYIDYNAPLYSAVEKMRSEDTGVLAVMRAGKLSGIITAPHVESVIALYISRKRHNRASNAK